jgi:hypothetical protein
MRRAHAIFKGPIFKVQVVVGATGAGFRQQKADARALAGQDYVMTNTGGLACREVAKAGSGVAGLKSNTLHPVLTPQMAERQPLHNLQIQAGGMRLMRSAPASRL